MGLLLLILLLVFIRIIVISIITKKWVQLRIAIFVAVVFICLSVLAMRMLSLKGREVEIRRSILDMNETIFSINYLLKNNEEILDVFTITDHKGRFLTNKEIADLQASYMQSAGFRFLEYDRWGNRFEIYYIRTKGEIEKLNAISKGPDGIIETPDDLMVPEN